MGRCTTTPGNGRGTLAAVSARVVLIGGAHDGREFHVPDDDPIVTTGVMDIADLDDASPADMGKDPATGQTFMLRYRWDGTVRDDGTRRYRLAR
jgi:hypothetical protein